MQYLRRIERILPVAAPVTLRVANHRGDVVVIGEDRDHVTFVVQIALDARDETTAQARLDAIEIPVRVDGGSVTIGPPTHPERDEYELRIDEDIRAAGESFPFFNFRFGPGGIIAAARRAVSDNDLRVDMELHVPRRCTVEVEQRTGTLRIEGVQSRVDARSRSGRVEIHDIDGDVSLETRSGPAQLRGIRGSATVDSRSGRLDVSDVDGDVTVDSRSGRVGVRNIGGRADLRTYVGSVRVEGVRGPLDVVGDSGSIEVSGAVLAPIAIEAQTGSVRLFVPPGARFYLDAESRLGSVRSDLPIGDGRAPEADASTGAPTVRVRSLSGSVRIGPL
ncbi:MAG: DUF4097 family beta strand repeat-containing protein [Chloroflexi bacterium]|nr:DUF4097 family beta strand repeat-containing protein [Chloroflexota bacterium]MDA1002368.1 DUF4097 family beta strand repeat-containing protein [Chloroflexota bacterium]